MKLCACACACACVCAYVCVMQGAGIYKRYEVFTMTTFRPCNVGKMGKTDLNLQDVRMASQLFNWRIKREY
jgi:hypothetical protein